MTRIASALLAVTGLCAALLTADAAMAGPPQISPIEPQRPFNPQSRAPQVNPQALQRGLHRKAQVSPKTLSRGGVAMDVHSARRVEASRDRVLMDKHTQLWLHFEAAARTSYDIDCTFAGRQGVLISDYADGKYVRQQVTTPNSSGKLHHRVYSRPNASKIKVFMQAKGDLKWSSCTVEPS